MAPLPINTTSRTVVRYTFEGREYSVQYRFVNAVKIATIQTLLNSFHDTIHTEFYSDWFNGSTCLFYPQGIDWSNEYTLTPTASAENNPQPVSEADATQWEFLGRSADGRRARWFYQGLRVPGTAKQRVYVGVPGPVQNVRTALLTLVGAGLCTISGATPVLKDYANQVVNDYLTRKARRG